mmetsp:Transcript_33283/g.69999  ORF Transcript_33283/g.69999 Transcript_33283/m.69999 type:complete len:195 (-) Transcript_33283:623-1207(-)|eukprot:CAMPEP_0172329050 /NCGR_PEP_ID=MMETSP1058-20130122/60675_1 /TAXON_ID=83371 /ORGANISM="Detonula confervacea, Strain CCMP 353" /LENGTH=194 /DNA_ID=CAMNT_0013046197 /DNA_START=1131 /DNA_END=1715 /DNA_ORIENTATION=-
MPTAHWVKQKSLKRQHGIGQLPWSVSLENENKSNPSVSAEGSTKRSTLSGGLSLQIMERRANIDTTKHANTNQHMSSDSETNGNGNKDKQPRNRSTQYEHGCMLDDKQYATGRCASIGHLKRKSEELIYVKIGNTEHQAFELENPDNLGENDTVWVEWAMTGGKECVLRHQIMKDGLQARKRQRPAKYSSKYCT